MRARAVFIAWMLAVQTLAPSLALASTVRAACCCATADEKKCHCPACSKVRAIEEGHGLVGSCGHDGGKAVPTSLIAAAPAHGRVRAVPEAARRAPPSPRAAPPSPAEEVPTPPPLA